MLKDLEIIKNLETYELNLTRINEDEFQVHSDNNCYVLKKQCVVKLMIADKKINSEILEIIFKFSKLEELYLRRNHIDKIPDAITSLTCLKRLHLGNNALMRIPESLTKLESLQILSLYSNEIKVIPENLTELNNLIELNLNNNLIVRIPRSISHLVKLERLLLRKNHIADVSEDIASLSKLRHIDLNDNEIINIPNGIFMMKNLERLDLNANKIIEIPNKINGLENLIRFYVNENKIIKISNDISKLNNLKIFGANKNLLTEIPDGICNLKNLVTLKLNSNRISEIPESISKLTNLEELFLLSNKISIINENISGMVNLKRLLLNSNQINKLPDQITSLQMLMTLNLSNNLITEIPQDIVNLHHLRKFNLNNNPIVNNLKEIEELNPQELISYLLSIQKSDVKPLNEAKILVVGDERVGKTSIINRIVGNDFDKNQTTTEGIDILNYKFSNEIKTNIWDFAGQEITHQTHQFFLSTRSLYLYVIDAQKEDNDSTIFDWLEIIKSTAGNSPIIIVINRIDENSGYKFDEYRYKKDFNIVDIIYTSALYNKNVNVLTKSIESTIENLENVKNSLAKEWFDVKAELEKFASDNKDYIERETFENICNSKGVSTELEQNALLKILDEIGTVVSYTNKRLHNVQIINPLWITNAVYKVIRSGLLTDNAILSENNFKEIFSADDRYKERHYIWIIDLLNQFEISFDIASNKILIPSKLPTNQPNFCLESFQSGLNLRYKYKSKLKKSVISQFIVKLNDYIDRSEEVPYWKRGVFLKYYDCNAVVISDEEKKTINISISKKGKQGRDFLSIIRYVFREINSQSTEVSEEIPLILDGNIVGYKDYEYLVSLENNNIREVPFEVDLPSKFHTFNVANLLDGYIFGDLEVFNYMKFKNDLIEISQLETENRNAIFHESEDQTNDRFRTDLLNRGYIVADQSRGGDSQSGKQSGERDIVIRNENGVPETVIEAFNLDGFVTEIIDKHYKKLIEKYDTTGNNTNFILVYSKTKDFDKLWASYKGFYDTFSDSSENDNRKKNIKVGITKHRQQSIYHIFINFYSC